MLEERFADAYIKESPRPDCLPEMRFRVTLPDGTMEYAASEGTARFILVTAIMDRRRVSPERDE